MPDGMTALDKYTRLEALGQWSETSNVPPVEVIVSFGDATLLLSKPDETPLSHWAMAATMLTSLENGVATYTPDIHGHETLEIDDPAMIEAIAQVSQTQKPQQKRKSLRIWFLLLLLVALVIGAFGYGPTTLRTQAINMTTPDLARQIGYKMLTQQRIVACRSPSGDKVRNTLQNKIFPNGNYSLIIATNAPLGAIFTGGLLVVDNTALAQFSNSNELTIWMAILAAEPKNAGATQFLFENAPVSSLIQYVRTGQIADTHLADTARLIVRNAKTSIPEMEDRTIATAVLRHQDWLALKSICQD